MSPLISGLRNIIPERLRLSEPMNRHTSWRIGGPAEFFCRVHDVEELRAVINLFRRHGTPWRILGGGTNLLVSDQGVEGGVIQLTGGFRRSRWEDSRFICGAGNFLARLARQALDSGHAGLEFAGTIPGTVGGAVVGNAGTPLGCMADIIRETSLLGSDGRVRALTGEEIGFEYRHSSLKGTDWVVLEAVFDLPSGDSNLIRERMEAQLASRRQRQPWQLPSAGSVFRNPPGDYAGRLIEAAGLKGARRGAAQVSEMHANFIVNLGGASASDVLGLIEEAKKLVLDRFGVLLEEEILYWG